MDLTSFQFRFSSLRSSCSDILLRKDWAHSFSSSCCLHRSSTSSRARTVCLGDGVLCILYRCKGCAMVLLHKLSFQPSKCNTISLYRRKKTMETNILWAPRTIECSLCILYHHYVEMRAYIARWESYMEKRRSTFYISSLKYMSTGTAEAA